jgi:hypothetical protein
VAGFDDSNEALTSELTSYSFNTAALAQASLQHVMQAGTQRPAGTARVVEIPGVLMARRSTTYRAGVA